MKILIVDDELVSRKTLGKLLENIGECELVDNGEAALQTVLSDNPPDLILLDVIMPGIDGYEVCERLKTNETTRDIPIIFLSANTNAEDITRGIQLGAIDYVTKPFFKDEVKARVQTQLDLHQMRKDLQKKNIDLQRSLTELEEKTDELREKDRQLIEMDRIAGIGSLAAGIAHEINNPLGFIKSSIGFLNKSLNKALDAVKYWDDKPLPEELAATYKDYLDDINLEHVINSKDRKYETILRGIDRIMNIIGSLKRFSRIDQAGAADLDINQSIDDAVIMLCTGENENLSFKKDFQEIPLLSCAAGEINQCLFHVLKNALDAVDQNGTIEIITRYQKPEELINIIIRDNGKGMSEEEIKQAFTPFYTTKAVGSGTGMGLSMTEAIIKHHNGSIELVSTIGEGTTVTLTLPVELQG